MLLLFCFDQRDKLFNFPDVAIFFGLPGMVFLICADLVKLLRPGALLTSLIIASVQAVPLAIATVIDLFYLPASLLRWVVTAITLTIAIAVILACARALRVGAELSVQSAAQGS